jgi:hypothetical protein
MAMYDLQPDVKWPQQLGRVIQSYAQGQEVKRQRDMEMAQTLMLARKLQQEQEKRSADIERVKALTALMGRFGGGETQMPQGGGLQLDRIGASGPSFKVQQPETAEDIKAQIAKDASVLKNLPEDSPMRKLVEESMLRSRRKLADIMGMEAKTTPAKEPWYWFNTPEKTEYVPKGSQRRWKLGQ